MSEVTVRVLGEDDWQEYRTLRLAGLQESPNAFVDTYEEEVTYDEQRWRSRLQRAVRLLAELDGEPVGIASVATVGDEPTVADVFGLYVLPAARQAGVAWKLMEAAADVAAINGRTHLHYWVGEENIRAIAFASNFGFRPSHERRPARVPREGFGDVEIAMVLPIGPDPAAVPTADRSTRAARSAPHL